jgi:metal-responsive CopG/Arc/MetJ family transcriptional regulator
MGGRAPLEQSRRSRPNVTRFGVELDRQVGEIAVRQGVTRSQLIRDAVKDYLAKAADEAAAAS